MRVCFRGDTVGECYSAYVEISFSSLFFSLRQGSLWPGAQMYWKLLRSNFGSEGHQSQRPEGKGTNVYRRSHELVIVQTATTHEMISRGSVRIFISPTQGRLEQKLREFLSPRWEIFDLEEKMHCLIAENSWLSSCSCVCACLSVFRASVSVGIGVCRFRFCICLPAPVSLVGGGEEWDPGHE